MGGVELPKKKGGRGFVWVERGGNKKGNPFEGQKKKKKV